MREYGSKTFILTNSEYEYTHVSIPQISPHFPPHSPSFLKGMHVNITHRFLQLSYLPNLFSQVHSVHFLVTIVSD